MIETERGSLMQRALNFALGKRFESRGSNAAHDPTVPRVLLWLAGEGYKPRRASTALKPASRQQREVADRLLAIDPPASPVEAAAARSELLSELRHQAPEDYRVKAIFDADPIIVEDPQTHILVTESILAARLAHFDALYALFGNPPLGPAARDRIRDALVDAFVLLSPGAQEEWALGEYRLAETLGFLRDREPTDIRALSGELRPVFEARGGWEAARLLSHAAGLSFARGGAHLPVADLLELNRARIAAQ